jgi:Subtilase family/FG-GAP-like repeat
MPGRENAVVRQGFIWTIVVWLSLAGSAWAAFPYSYDGTAPSDLQGKLEWMYAATPEQGNALVNADPRELGGVRGASVVDRDPTVATAWQTTTGRPDVTIAVLDSGIEWNDLGAMKDLRAKTRLNRGELSVPLHDRAAPACASFTDDWDANGDGVFNVLDYACDSRVDPAPALGDGPVEDGQPLLDPQDVLIAFTDGTDDDRNGFRDDVVGWDFLDDDNDPFDDVQYGHGTGEARDSTAEADNGGELGTCPNCMSIHLRVGDSFIADESDFAQAVLYAVDNDVEVVQEALGTLNHTSLGRDAVEYAYDNDVAVIASAADEAAQHHNWPSNEPHTIVVNSVTMYDETLTAEPRSYLQFNGCTNFSSKIAVAIPSVSCSSDATGRAAGMAGLIYSAALDRGIELSANEVRQLMTATADDVNFAATELSCSPVPADPCTDPNLNSVNPTRLVAPFPATVRYPARKGHDWFYGYGRIDVAAAVTAAVPPSAEITAPDWYSLIDPGRVRFDVRGEVSARGGAYRCILEVAPGSMPHDTEDFEPVGGGHCNGASRSGPFSGVVGRVDVAALKDRFPPSAGDFTGREPGALGQSSNGRPNSDPYGFTLRLRVEAPAAGGGPTLRGEDRRNLFLHRDADLLPGFPRTLPSDGEASPVLADLDGDNRNELIVATADGTVHAYRPDGREAPGWPVRGERLPLHTGGAAFRSGAVSPDASRGAFLASPAVGDLDRDGTPEVVAADYEGRVYAWGADGRRRWMRTTTPEWSGRPLSPFDEARKGERNRTQRGFVGSPVLADLDSNGRLEVIAAAMDRHVYAWRAGGAVVPGFPSLVVDASKVASVDPATHQVTFNEQAGESLMQGAIVDTPAVGDLTGDGRPEIVVGTNEEYSVNAPGEGGLNADNVEMRALEQAAGATGVLDPAHSRVFALDARGRVLPGWPAKIGKLTAELLPIVGEGITGSPVIGPAECAGAGAAVGAIPDAGLGYLLGPDGDSCLGSGPDGRDRVLDTLPPAGVVQDTPAFPAVGHPAFGDFGGGVSFLAPAAGLRRALDAAVNEYQQGSQDFVGAWSTRDGRFRPGFPAVVNDLQFLTGPTVADVDGQAGEEVVGGTASQDLYAIRADGRPVSDAWPKLTSDWMVANPVVGSFGATGGKVIVAITRSGTMLAYRTGAPTCSPSSWPRFHHDEANSGDMRRDGTPPGRPTGLRARGGRLLFAAPGDDLLCGRATAYELSTGGAFRRVEAAPADGGKTASVPLPAGAKTVSVRAVDEQGNVGRSATLELR